MSDYFCGIPEHRHRRVGDAAECALKQKDAELTELRVVLAAADIHKENGIWVKRCPVRWYGSDSDHKLFMHPLECECGGKNHFIISIPNLAPVAGGSHD